MHRYKGTLMKKSKKSGNRKALRKRREARGKTKWRRMSVRKIEKLGL